MQESLHCPDLNPRSRIRWVAPHIHTDAREAEASRQDRSGLLDEIPPVRDPERSLIVVDQLLADPGLTGPRRSNEADRLLSLFPEFSDS